jgi:hypothetical protein
MRRATMRNAIINVEIAREETRTEVLSAVMVRGRNERFKQNIAKVAKNN